MPNDKQVEVVADARGRTIRVGSCVALKEHGAAEVVLFADHTQVVTQLQGRVEELEAAEADLTSLRSELARLLGPREPREGVTANAQWIAAVADVLARAEKAKQQLAKQEEALRFYADPETYFAIGFWPDPPCGEFSEDFEEIDGAQRPGKRARAALTNTKEGDAGNGD